MVAKAPHTGLKLDPNDEHSKQHSHGNKATRVAWNVPGNTWCGIRRTVNQCRVPSDENHSSLQGLLPRLVVASERKGRREAQGGSTVLRSTKHSRGQDENSVEMKNRVTNGDRSEMSQWRDIASSLTCGRSMHRILRHTEVYRCSTAANGMYAFHTHSEGSVRN